MSVRYGVVLVLLCFSFTINFVDAVKQMKIRHKKVFSPETKGIQCYNCLSSEHPGCWDPDHPHYANVTVPDIDCYIPGMKFVCIVITSESAKFSENGLEIGPVRARTCVPAKDFLRKRVITYSMCNKLSKKLSTSGMFSRIAIFRPQCTICRKHLCTRPPQY